MAYRIERNNLYRYQGKRSDVAVCHDFHAAGDTDGSYYVDDSANKYYRIVNISKYATQVKITDESWIAKLNSSLFKSKPEVSFANYPPEITIANKKLWYINDSVTESEWRILRRKYHG